MIELTKTDQRLEAIQFLSKSMLPKDGRFHAGHIKVEEDGSAVSTDGSRLHWVNDIALEPGYYKVFKVTKTGALIDKVYELDTDEGTFPDYIDILAIPEGEGETSFDTVLNSERASGSYTKVIRAMSSSTLEFSFINDLCSIFDDVFAVIVPKPEGNHNDDLETCRPVHFIKNGYHAVVMPKLI